MTVSSETDLKVGFALGIDGSFSIVIWNGRGYIKWKYECLNKKTQKNWNR